MSLKDCLLLRLIEVLKTKKQFLMYFHLSKLSQQQKFLCIYYIQWLANFIEKDLIQRDKKINYKVCL